jgi:multidrug efflux system membrane fusion protein
MFTILLPALAAGCSSPPAAAPDRHVAVVDSIPVHDTDEAARRFSGVVRPRQEVTLAFRRPGRVVALTVEIGDHVRAGQVLGRLDRLEAQAGNAQGEAELAAARAEAQAAQDAANRATGLDGMGALSGAEVRQRTLTARAASAKVDAARAAARQHRTLLSDTLLVAPQDGVITEKLVDPGGVVDAGTPVLKLASGAAEVEIRAPADLRLTPGMTANASPPNDGQPVSARLRLVSPEGDPALHLRKARFVLDATTPSLPYNSTVTLVLRPSGPAHPIRVPLSAIDDRDGHPYVWVIAPQTHRIRHQRVVITDWRGQDALVTGLQGGQSIVATAADTLVEGQSVVDAGVEPGFH